MARIIADLAGVQDISTTHLAEALNYRPRMNIIQSGLQILASMESCLMLAGTLVRKLLVFMASFFLFPIFAKPNIKET